MIQTQKPSYVRYRIPVLLLGDGGVGKSTYMRYLQNGQFERKYVPTRGCIDWHFYVLTYRGWIDFKLVDTAGQEKFRTDHILYDKSSHKDNAAIIMADVTNRLTMGSIDDYLKLTNHINNRVVIFNKFDIPPKKIPTFEGVPRIDISVKKGQNLMDPLLLLVREHFNDHDIDFIDYENVIANRAYLLTLIKWIQNNICNELDCLLAELEDQFSVQLIISLAKLPNHLIKLILMCIV